jgi:hypothetical protein
MDIDSNVISTERCASAFGRMFWGYLFFIDFHVGINNVHVDLLPDFVGWLLIASALATIVDLSPKVAGLRNLAFWLVFLSLFDLVEIRTRLSQSGTFTTWTTPTLPIGIIAAVLDIFFMWRLCGLIIDMASLTGDRTIGNRADFRRRLYVALVVALAISIVIMVAVPPFGLVVLVIGLPLTILVYCLMMGLMKGTEKMCRGYEAPVLPVAQ